MKRTILFLAAVLLYGMLQSQSIKYEAFDVYFPLFFPPTAGKYRIEARNLHTGEPIWATVDAVTRQERASRLQDRHPRSIEDLWSFKIIDDLTGYLKLGTFSVWNFKMEWKDFLQNAFQTMEKPKIEELTDNQVPG